MIPPAPPRVTAVEVVATQPTDADRSVIAHLSTLSPAPLETVTYIVKIKFEEMPPVTSQGWALYVNDERIPKYWAYKDGIFFKVYDPTFFAKHQGKALRFSLDGAKFVDTGKTLPRRKPRPQQSANAAVKLPLQSDVLK
jgi:hypothetical protein